MIPKPRATKPSPMYPTTTTNYLESKKVWLVRADCDPTGGKESDRIAHVCWNEATARRVAKWINTENGRVSEAVAYRINDTWYAPADIKPPTGEDMEEERKLAKKRERASARDIVIARAKELGLTDEDLNLLKDAK